MDSMKSYRCLEEDADLSSWEHDLPEAFVEAIEDELEGAVVPLLLLHPRVLLAGKEKGNRVEGPDSEDSPRS